MSGQGTAFVGGDGGAVGPQVNSNNVHTGARYEGIQPAGQRLGFAAALGVQTTQAVLAEENASAVGSVSQTMVTAAEKAISLEETLPDELLHPPGGDDPATFLGRHVDDQVAATVPAMVTVKPLKQRQMDRDGLCHGFGDGREPWTDRPLKPTCDPITLRGASGWT